MATGVDTGPAAWAAAEAAAGAPVVSHTCLRTAQKRRVGA